MLKFFMLLLYLDLIKGFVMLPAYMLAESVFVLWELLKHYHEVRSFASAYFSSRVDG